MYRYFPQMPRRSVNSLTGPAVSAVAVALRGDAVSWVRDAAPPLPTVAAAIRLVVPGLEVPGRSLPQ